MRATLQIYFKTQETKKLEKGETNRIFWAIALNPPKTHSQPVLLFLRNSETTKPTQENAACSFLTGPRSFHPLLTPQLSWPEGTVLSTRINVLAIN